MRNIKRFRTTQEYVDSVKLNPQVTWVDTPGEIKYNQISPKFKIKFNDPDDDLYTYSSDIVYSNIVKVSSDGINWETLKFPLEITVEGGKPIWVDFVNDRNCVLHFLRAIPKIPEFTADDNTGFKISNWIPDSDLQIIGGVGKNLSPKPAEPLVITFDSNLVGASVKIQYSTNRGNTWKDTKLDGLNYITEKNIFQYLKVSIVSGTKKYREIHATPEVPELKLSADGLDFIIDGHLMTENITISGTYS